MNDSVLRFLRAARALLLVALVASQVHAAAYEKLRVVATIPDLADVVREIGGERVEVATLTKGRENLHRVAVRPSHLVALSRADVFVQVGLSLESSFVPGLLESARNARIQPGEPGFVNVSEGWTALDVPASVDRKGGDVHPHGNPHMNLDPRAGRHIAERVLAGLVRADPGSKELFEKRHAAYVEKLDAAEARWEAAGKAWSGRKVVVYHKEFDYLAALYGLVIVGSIEPKPGIPPTPNSIARLVEELKQAPGATILTASWSNDRVVAEIAERSGASVVELPNQCSTGGETETWIGMMDLVHERLARAFGPAEEQH